MRRRVLVAVWLAASLGAAGYLALRVGGDDRTLFLPGETTAGHYQIELACESCHEPFGGVRQEACLTCHEAELEAAEDSHPAALFDDPRNAADLELLDVRRCVACHTEHRPGITGEMGVTLPADFCRQCHAEIAAERPTHEGLAFDGCAASGCHNYHDNRALYEDFLVRHADSPEATFPGTLPDRGAWVSWEPAGRVPLAAADADGPASASSSLVAGWAGSAHADGGVNCTDCHRVDGAAWTDRPPREQCGSCHELEHAGFITGRHGMRWPAGLASMSPALARLPMKPHAFSLTLECGSCHDVHEVDAGRAAAVACLNCHADEHSLAYVGSPHHRLWERELAGEGAPGSGVSCASCHLPRESRRVAGEERTVVQHNQNANLRPNEKMVREICMTCHSLGFSLDALADPALIRSNFAHLPEGRVRSIDMALSRRE